IPHTVYFNLLISFNAKLDQYTRISLLVLTICPVIGASRLIHHLHENGIPICVATGTHTRHFDLKTQRHSELFSLMHHIVRGDDPEVKQGKPSPDIFLAAANRFEGGPVDPQIILVFEDAPSGVLAAKNAGMSVVMVPDARLDSSYHQVADQVLNSLLDFSPDDWGLPPLENASTNSISLV
ncbi:(DL)-glycerol-3-phosphatase 2, partial [Solanum tuberosum]|uniref:(DL)-glycerol-3-phosphatase 2 n=1 Tax=Solanum tuberosum TaxID=4113 RepID=UPI0003D28F3C